MVILNLQFNLFVKMIKGDKRYYDYAEVTTPTKIQNGQQLSKSRLAQFAMEMQGNKALTPSRIKQRVSCSPLKFPLEKAIQRAVNSKQSQDRSPTSRTINRSSKGCDSRISNNTRRSQIEEPVENRQGKAHTQTYNFLRKYFDLNAVEIPTQTFIRRLLQEYEGLWGTDNAGHIIQDFTYKIEQIFGVEIVQVRQLIRMTKNDGMIGLILQIFKQIKQDQTTRMSNYSSFSQNPNIISIHKSFQSRMTEDESITNIKNVVQQFMQTMYQCMQNEIYSKFNVEMRRMVLKYREAERLLKKVNEKLTLHADIFDLQKKYASLEKNYEAKLQQLKKSKEKAELNLEREKQVTLNIKNQKQKLAQQNSKLQQNLEKYQNAILNKALDNIPNAEMIMSRRTSGLADRTNDYMNGPYSMPSEPFKVQIDTHIVHKQFAPPQMKTVTTVHQNNVSPRKGQLFDVNYGQRTSQGSLGRPSYSTTPYQPKSPYR